MFSAKWLALASVLVFSTAGFTQTEYEMRPLEQPSESVGDTLFSKVSPEHSRIDFINTYDDQRMWGDRYQEMVFGTIGTGVAVADFDNDGKVDVFFAAKTGGSRLYRNLGDWRFEDVSEKAGLWGGGGSWFGLFDDDSSEDVREVWDQGAVFADVNGDGWLDLYVTCFDAPNRLYVNQGDGTFKNEAEKRGLAIRDASGMAVFADYDRDGWLDVYVQTNMLSAIEGPEGREDYLLRNKGDGYFEAVTEAAGMGGVTSGHSASWWDFDGDGWLDLYVANDYSKPDNLYRNNGDGTFTDFIREVVPRMPYYSMGSDFGDVNGDGLMDFFVADMAPTSHEKDQRGMAVSRAREMSGRMERVAPQQMHNTLYLNTGLTKMQEIAFLAGVARSDWTWSVRFEDLDCDGFLDLHVTNGMVREYHNVDILDRIMGAESRMAQRRVMRSSPVLAESNLAFRNLGDLRFERRETEWGLDEVGVSFGVGFGDFDGDGDLDLVYSNYDAAPSVFRNDTPDGSRLVIELRGSVSNHFGVGAVVTLRGASGEQTRGLVSDRGYLSSSEPVIHFGLGEDERVERLEIRWPSGQVQVLEDLPVNQRLLVREPSGTPPVPADPYSPEPLLVEWDELSLEPIPGRAPPRPDQPLSPLSDRRRGPALAVGDLDGDGLDDAVVGSSGGDSTQALLSSREFGPIGLPGRSYGFAEGALEVVDFDQDGDLDLVIASSSGAGPAARILLNDGSGKFSEAGWEIPESEAAIASASVGDFDGDGFPDLFLGARSPRGSFPLPGTSLLLRGTGKGFDNASKLLPAAGKLGSVSDSVWSDVDGDGSLDLIVATEWGEVRCLLSREGLFEDASERLGFDGAGNGWWQSLSAGDFNGDGRPDFVLGNMGLNTPYQANSEEPAVLYFGDFGGRGYGQLVEGRWDSGRLMPLRSRKELGDAIPSLLRRFRSNDEFAAATLEEVFGAEALSSTQRFTVEELQSGTLLSGPSGYRFVAFPRIGQASPLRSMAVLDLNGDGLLDIACSQNLHEVDPVVGRFDGGLGQVFLGDGTGGFRALAPSESGLVIPGDSASIASGDFDGDGRLELIATRWGEPMLGFRVSGNWNEVGEGE